MVVDRDDALLDHLRRLTGEAWRLGAEAQAGRGRGPGSLKVLLSDFAALSLALEARRVALEADLQGSVRRFAASACYQRTGRLAGRARVTGARP